MRIKAYLVILAMLASILGAAFVLYKQNNKLRSMVDDRESSIQALIASNDSIANKNVLAYQTINEIQYYKDSISIELLNTAKELKIKEKQIKALYAINSKISSRDSILIKDTIFIRGYQLDTTIKDDWRSLRLKLAYPNTVDVETKFNSKKQVILHTKRFIPNPSKIFFIRWFQKKKTRIEVEVIEKNPYIEETDNRFIEIVK